ncbi:MAG: hypothetical protein AB8H86_25425 [Polyangiales bacterium]
MIIPQDELFRREAAKFGLRWNCEDCSRFNNEARCAHGFPTEKHRRARYEDPDASLYFCKEFDLK